MADIPDRDEIAEMAQDARRRGPTADQAAGATAALMALMERHGMTEFVMTAEELAAHDTDCGQCILVSPEAADGSKTFSIVDDPPSLRAQAVLDGGADWLRAASGQAVKVTGADGDMVIHVVEVRPGVWSEPERYHADCFLRDHVLAGGVPLLG